ncbi:hypothetical protein AB0L53_44545 [Nonomuraea sp. NPDC052129]|uniref:hypothetical protein n=1 Tax=Nonomuraea sp. NPDC052129 TaxID=3154651 RepID=UPI00341FBB87
MLATRTLRSRRPAARDAGRLLTHAVFAIALVLSVVFAHGGACAAVELSEPVAHSAQLAGGGVSALAHGTHSAAGGVSPVTHGVRCLHRDLPVGHVHGTEQDRSATNPTGAPPVPAGSAVELPRPAAQQTAQAPSSSADIGRGVRPDQESVMRV